MGDKPVIVCINIHNPTVVCEFEKEVDGIIVEFGVEISSLFDIIFGNAKPSGRLAIIMPKNMDTVELHNEDIFDDIEPYEDEMGNIYNFVYGVNW